MTKTATASPASIPLALKTAKNGIRIEKKCKLKGCRYYHDYHICQFCKSFNSHFSNDCPNKPKINTNIRLKFNLLLNSKCKNINCLQVHSKHYCRICDNQDSDHFARQCPAGITLYHGTTLQAAQNISKTSFIQSKTGRMGAGIYFTPSKSIAQKIGQRTKNQAQSVQFVVIECKFLYDKNYVNQGEHPAWKNSFDKISNQSFTEYVVKQQFANRIKIVDIHKIYNN